MSDIFFKQNGSNYAWDTVGNWYTNYPCTTLAGNLPVDGDTVYISTQIDSGPSAPIALNAIFVDPSIMPAQSFTVNITGATATNIQFFAQSIHTGTLGDNILFNDGSSNRGVVGNYATFNDGSFNDGSVRNYATFNTGSSNSANGTVGSYCTFNGGGCINYGMVMGTHATFAYSAVNQGVGGHYAHFNGR